jgi:hypothetical protein
MTAGKPRAPRVRQQAKREPEYGLLCFVLTPILYRRDAEGDLLEIPQEPVKLNGTRKLARYAAEFPAELAALNAREGATGNGHAREETEA